MGCCNNHYRKAVEAEECRINEKGKDQIPMLLKILMGFVILIALWVSLS